MKLYLRSACLAILFLFLFTLTAYADVQRVYDEADLLKEEEMQDLENQTDAYFEEWETDFIIITIEGTQEQSIREYLEDFTDQLSKEFNRQEDNMIALALDIGNREFFVMGIGRGEEYIDNNRVEKILDHITPPIVEANYFEAFELFFTKADEYLNVRPGVNPDSIFLNTFFQFILSLVLAGVIVFFMAYRTGGRNTVTSGTYLNQNHTKIIRKKDRYLRRTVTRTKRPRTNKRSGGGGFGGGGTTRAGRSYSGGGRKF